MSTLPPDNFALVLPSRSTSSIARTPPTPSTPHTPASGQGSVSTDHVAEDDEDEELDVEDDEQANTLVPKKRTRGVVTLAPTAKKVKLRKDAPFFVKWHNEKNKYTIDHPQPRRFVYDLGVVVRNLTPLTHATLSEHGPDAYARVYTGLSPFYGIDRNSRSLIEYIYDRCNHMYSLSGQRELYDESKGEMPEIFKNRVEEWDFICKHFTSKEYKALSDKMKDMRGSKNKFNHASGPTPFEDRAEGFQESVHPRLDVFELRHKKAAPDIIEKLKVCANKKIDELKATQSTQASQLTCSNIDGTLDTANSKICLPLSKEVEVFGEVFGEVLRAPRGTKVSGMGGAPIRLLKKRGPSKGIQREPVIDEEAALKIEMLEAQVGSMKAQMEKLVELCETLARR